MSKELQSNQQTVKNTEDASYMPPHLQPKVQSKIQPKVYSKIQAKLMTDIGKKKKQSSETTTSTKLPEEVQGKMENSFGQDFSAVKFHKDSTSAVDLNARAYAEGENIHFAPGEYNPSTKVGQELIGHELTHVVQQRQKKVGKGEVHGKGIEINQDSTLEKEADEMGKLAANGENTQVAGEGFGIQTQKAPATPTKEELDEIVTRYNNMVAKARIFGYNVAADNLAHFLNGNGKTRILSSSWLRGYDAITDAEEVNQGRFEESLIKKADALKDGETKSFSDYWDRGLYAAGMTELFYASGGSTIKSRGNFTLTRKGELVTISGTVNHHWYDPYDWHAGLTAFVPGYGDVSDADALLLQQYRGAQSFLMESDWQQVVTGTVETDRWTDYFGTEFNWKLK
jgi:hypothetical protein